MNDVYFYFLIINFYFSDHPLLEILIKINHLITIHLNVCCSSLKFRITAKTKQTKVCKNYLSIKGFNYYGRG